MSITTQDAGGIWRIGVLGDLTDEECSRELLQALQQRGTRPVEITF